jgi:hypothetical protein
VSASEAHRNTVWAPEPFVIPIAVTNTDVEPGSLTEYYTSCQQGFRLFDNQESLLCLLDQPGHEAMALKYAICAHALSLRTRPQPFSVSGSVTSASDSCFTNSPKSDHAGFFYRLARAALNQSDMGKRSTAAMLRTLQATILVGLHELQQAEFSCAWLSASRAVWLTEELQLHLLDSDQTPPSPHGGQHTERRAFWAARGLAAFLTMVHGNGGMLCVDSVSVSSPSFQLISSDNDACHS